MGKENLRFYLGEIDEVSGEIVHWIGEIGFSLLQQNILLWYKICPIATKIFVVIFITIAPTTNFIAINYVNDLLQ